MKLSKVISIVTVSLMLVAMVSSVAFAIDPSNITGTTTGAGASSVQKLGKSIIGIIQVVGSVAAVAVLVVLGIKYMMGSAEEKAEYKKTLMPYIIGAIIVLAAVNIVNWVFGAASGFFA